MKLIQLMKIADEGYRKDFPESSLLECVNRRTGRPLDQPPSGDTLALFVVRELSETFESKASDHEQLAEAARCVEKAVNDLGNILSALDKPAPAASKPRADRRAFPGG